MTLDNFRSIDLTLDFANKYLSAPEITAVAGDANGRKLHLTITDSGTVQDLTSQTVVLYWKHTALGTSGMATFTATDPKNGVFDIFLPTDMLYSGRVDANIQVIDSVTKSAIMSRTLTIRVESGAYDENAAMATNAYSSLQDILTLWKTLPQQIQDWLTKYANVQINQGGTGASTRAGAFANLSYLGLNPIATKANDTFANWGTQGSGFAFYNTNILNNQPTTYGFLINYYVTDGLFQIWVDEAYGGIYYRTGNSTGWYGSTTDSGTWKRFSDSRNPLPIITADATSTGMAYTITNSTLPTSLPWGYTFKFIPNTTSTTQKATLSLNGGTACPFDKINTYTGVTYLVSTSNSSTSFLQGGFPYTLTYWSNRWIILEQPLVDLTAPVGTLPVANGGTGATAITGLVKGNGTGAMTAAVMGTDYAQAHPVGAVITNSSNSASGYAVGTWSNIGSATIGTTTVYYWKRTA